MSQGTLILYFLEISAMLNITETRKICGYLSIDLRDGDRGRLDDAILDA